MAIFGFPSGTVIDVLSTSIATNQEPTVVSYSCPPTRLYEVGEKPETPAEKRKREAWCEEAFRRMKAKVPGRRT